MYCTKKILKTFFHGVPSIGQGFGSTTRGNDMLFGGDGNDVMYGGPGDDLL